MLEDELIVSDDEPVKKKPGRPKKVVVKRKIPHKGVVRAPSNAYEEETQPTQVNVLEVMDDNPLMFKKIFQLFKTMGSQDIRLRFEPEVLKIYQLVANKAKIYVKIFGKKLSRYYCEKPFEIGCNPSRIYDKLIPLSKSHSKITITTNRQHMRSKIFIIITNDEMDEDAVDDLEIDEIEPYDWDIEETLTGEERYPIRFVMPSKYFKKKITDLSKGCDILRIEKTGFENLRFYHVHNDRRGRHDSYYKNSGLINLISMLEEDDIFSTSVYTDDIKSFSSVLITDEIQIAADKDSDLIFTLYLDQKEGIGRGDKKYRILGTEKCVIKVVVRIVRSEGCPD